MSTKSYRISAQALLACLFLLCVYRAFTQSIVYDEALTWQLYILGPVGDIFQVFDANHHFLNTVLARLSTSVFGVSEWSMRLPALAGAALYFAACYRLTRTAFGDSFSMLLAIALATMNPLVLDFMVAARGYGLALALWMWASAVLLDAFSRKRYEPGQMAMAGAALALSVTANLIFVLPSAALGGLTLYFARNRSASPPLVTEAPMPAGPIRARGSRKKKRSSPAAQVNKPGTAPWVWFTAPIVVIAVLFFILAPFQSAHSEHFYTGAPSVQRSLRSLAASSLEHSGVLRAQPWVHDWTNAIAFAMAPLIVAAGLLVGIVRRNMLLILLAGTAVFSSVALLLIHLLLNKPFPADRTGLYFLPLVALILVGLAHVWSGPGPWRVASIAAYVMGVLLAVHFATEIDPRKFLVWEYDADTRELSQYLAAHRPQGQAIVRVGGSWQLQQSLAYYAVMQNWTWAELRKGEPTADLDFFALTPWDRTKVEKEFGLKEIYIGPVSGSALAVPQSSVAAR